jgi:ribosomal protein L11 methylase PrmA
VLKTERHPASFRDPDAAVFVAGGRLVRGLTRQGAAQYDAVRATGLLDALERDGLVVVTREGSDVCADPALARFDRVIEHEVVPFVSYPYEWPFELLQRAALLHLDVHLRALGRGVTLTDASAFNVQFRGVKPAFIDIASFIPYRDGQLWAAHRQFCEQFLNPLLLTARTGVTHHAWFRGSLEGIPTEALAALLPARGWLSPRLLFHVLLPARVERAAPRREAASVAMIRRAHLPKAGYVAMLRQLRAWIGGLAPRCAAWTPWSAYSETRTYQSTEIEEKRRVVAEFAARHRPATLWDLGCNDGEFAEVALVHGAGRVIGFDADPAALGLACRRADREALDFLPLYQDVANPSPGQGWLGLERASLVGRARPDAMMALAFAHHLALGRNIPLEEVVDLLCSLAPRGLIEFVPTSDPAARSMLALKGDIFRDYDGAVFERALAARARIVRQDPVSGSHRRIYWYER